VIIEVDGVATVLLPPARLFFYATKSCVANDPDDAMRSGPLRRRCSIGVPAGILAVGVAGAQPAPVDVAIDPVAVTATRRAERTLDVPASVDIIGRREIQQSQPMVNLSETLVRVPGIVANNRQNYAQDLQISSRGFGARAAFGVRGLRLYQDDIPQTMPDGQGQTGSFALLATERIEVLRGPFSALYGNASGGVITVFSESGTAAPEATFTGGVGSYETWTLGAKATGTARGIGYAIAASHFDTDGYRDHSAARRELAVAKVTFPLGEATKLTLLGTLQDQPHSQDPLGLTRAQWEADPTQADPVATQFDTRKSIDQQQVGATLDHRFDAETSLKVVGYGGHRGVEQYLALAGTLPASAGGVVDLDRGYGGASARLERRARVGEGLLVATVGADYDLQDETRRGYVNDGGQRGDLKRDEDDEVTSTAVYAQLVWWPTRQVSLTAGVRANEVRFKTTDHYIAAGNPDDSGSRHYRRTTPVAALLWQPVDTMALYVSYGEGFETPTFAELAYRPGATGLNLDLNAATSQAVEVGFKAVLGARHRINAAAFAIDTEDEIVANTATGGRTTFRNAGKTRRRGVELAWDGELGYGLTSHVALTWLRAEFASDFTTGTPPLAVPSGNKLPGVPSRTAYGELAWTPAALPWLSAAVEVLHVDRLYVNDRNSDFAPAYTTVNLRAGVEHRRGNLRGRAFVRVNNVADRDYVGSVIVGDTNGRFFEPAPGRNYFVGATLDVAL
jgi:iron complex outermembrane receptor protein